MILLLIGFTMRMLLFSDVIPACCADHTTFTEDLNWTNMIRITWTQLRSMLICTRTWQIMIALYFVVLVSSTQIVLALQSIHPDEISWVWRVWTCLVYLRPVKLLQALIMFGHLRCQAANANVGIEQLTNKEQTAAISEHRGVASCNWNCNISLRTGIFPEHFRTGQRGHNCLKLVIGAISLLEIHKKYQKIKDSCNFLCCSCWAFEVRVLNAFNCVGSSSPLIQLAFCALRPFSCGSCDGHSTPLF